jgi:hypothetical protein
LGRSSFCIAYSIALFNILTYCILVMNVAQLHLALNHLPFLGLLFGFFWLVRGALLRDHRPIGTAYFIIAACGVLALPVYLSGGAAEEQIEDMPGVSHLLISAHEAAATQALYFMLATAALALAAEALRRRHQQGRLVSGYKWALPIVMLSSALALGFVFNAARLGGHIRHPELLPLKQQQQTPAAAPLAPEPVEEINN